MPKRTDIHKVLIIGSGPIIIGQACEFDYSGTQACKALRKLGYEIVLVNSNPATIMTDPETADVTYIEPLNVERLEQIIAKERPDALLPNLGGQSGLNLCAELNKAGILDKYNVKVIGVQVDAIERGEDRIEFKKTMDKLGIEMARSEVAYSVDEALAIADKLGYPVVLRPAYTMGGAGGGLVYNKEELQTVCARGLQASLVGQVLVEESILGWEELELEVVRDADNNIITVCFIENIDPLGVHTGDSFCSAPMLTISEECQKRLQEQAYKIVESVQVIGGTNVQFAHDPVTDRIIVIEINPRTSRSKLPLEGTVLISVNDKDKKEVVEVAKAFKENGFSIVATGGTYDLITSEGIEATKVKKLYEGRPNVADMITNGEVQLIVNTPIGKNSVHEDSYLRKAAIKAKVPYITTIAAALATAEGINYVKSHESSQLKSLQELHSEIHDK